MSASLSYTREFFDFDPSRYDGLRVAEAEGETRPFRPDPGLFSGMNGVRARFRLGGVGAVRGSAGVSLGQTPIFDRGFGVPVEPGTQLSADLGVTLLPTRSLSLQGNVRHPRLNRARDGSRYSTATIPRIRAQYQFTKALYARVITEYAAQESGPLLDPDTGSPVLSCDGEDCTARTGRTSNSVSGEALVAYEPSPGTVVYLGYTRQMTEISAFRFQRLNPVSEGLFVKFSYNFRF